MDKLFVVLIPITTAVMQAVKDLIPIKFRPSASIGAGIIISILYFFTGLGTVSFWQAVLAGIIIGLSAAGLYDQGKILK